MGRKFFEPRELAIRTALELRSVTSAARAAIRALDPNQAIYDVRAMQDIHDENVAQPRFEMLLMGVFGGLAALLAALGVYGVMSYSVSRRTNEIGIRVALGAAGADVLRMVLRETLALALAGVALGLIGAIAMGRALQSLLFGVRATDPLTFCAVTGLLLAVAALASYLPARRASHVDPLHALRQD